MRPHRYDCHVRFSDVDVYGHVNNVKYFEYYQEARIAFLLAQGHDEGRGGALDAGWSMRQVVVRIDVDYHRPLLFRPEPYVVETWVTGIGTSSYDLSSRILDEGGASYSSAVVRMVAVDPETARSRPLSTWEREQLAAG